jgi:Phosphotransferase enzyme family
VSEYLEGTMWDRRVPSTKDLISLADLWIGINALTRQGLWLARGQGRTLAAVVARLRGPLDEPFPQHDVVHLDFTPLNLLTDASYITHVVDWEGLRAGDASFDLATLLFHGYADPTLRDQLWRLTTGQSSVGLIGALPGLSWQSDGRLLPGAACLPERLLDRGKLVLADVERWL